MKFLSALFLLGFNHESSSARAMGRGLQLDTNKAARGVIHNSSHRHIAASSKPRVVATARPGLGSAPAPGAGDRALAITNFSGVNKGRLFRRGRRNQHARARVLPRTPLSRVYSRLPRRSIAKAGIFAGQSNPPEEGFAVANINPPFVFICVN